MTIAAFRPSPGDPIPKGMPITGNTNLPKDSPPPGGEGIFDPPAAPTVTRASPTTSVNPRIEAASQSAPAGTPVPVRRKRKSRVEGDKSSCKRGCQEGINPAISLPGGVFSGGLQR